MLQALIGPVTGLLDKFIEDKDQKNALAHEIATMAEKQAHEAAMAQVEAHTEQKRQHRAFFVRRMAALRGLDVWVCALCYGISLYPCSTCLLFGVLGGGSLTLPAAPCSTGHGARLCRCCLGMLGPGRSADSWKKSKGCARDNAVTQ
jgi:rubrerythrin